MDVIVTMTKQQLHAAWKCCGWHHCDQRYQGTLPDGWLYLDLCGAAGNVERDTSLCPEHARIMGATLKPLPTRQGRTLSA